VEDAKAYPVGVGAIVDRSDGAVNFDMPLTSAVQMKAVTYEANRCPLCMQKIPLIKPGSRSTT